MIVTTVTMTMANDNDDGVDDGCYEVDEVTYSTKDVDRMITKLDGLIAANDPVSVARYVNDVAHVTNSPSIQDLVPDDDRRTVIIHTHFCLYEQCITAISFQNEIIIIILAGASLMSLRTPGKQSSSSNACPWLFNGGMRSPSKIL